MEEFKDIFDYFAYRAFQVELKAPEKPQYTLKEIFRFPLVGEMIKQALAHYLLEQHNLGLLDGSTEVEATEAASKFNKLYNLGVFVFEISFLDPENSFDVRVDLFVWNGEEYKIINEDINNYLLETEKLEKNSEIAKMKFEDNQNSEDEDV